MRKYLARLTWTAWLLYSVYVWFFDRHTDFWLNFVMGTYFGIRIVAQAIELRPLRCGIGVTEPPGTDEFNTWCYWFTAAMAFAFSLFAIWNLNA